MRTKCSHCGLKGRTQRCLPIGTVVGDPLQQPGPLSSGGGSPANAINGGESSAAAAGKGLDYATEGSIKMKGTAALTEEVQAALTEEVQEMLQLQRQTNAKKKSHRRMLHEALRSHNRAARRNAKLLTRRKKNIFKLIQLVPMKFPDFALEDFLKCTYIEESLAYGDIASKYIFTDSNDQLHLGPWYNESNAATSADQLAGMATLSLSDSWKPPVSEDQLAGMATLSLNGSSSTAPDPAMHSKVPVIADQIAGMAALSMNDQL